MPRCASAVLEDAMRRNARSAVLLAVLAGVLAVGGLALDAYAIPRDRLVLGFLGVLVAATAIAPLRAAAQLWRENSTLATMRAALEETGDVEPVLEALRALGTPRREAQPAIPSAAALATALDSGIRDRSLRAGEDTRGLEDVDVAAQLARVAPPEPDAVAPTGWMAGAWRVVWPALFVLLVSRRDTGGLAVPSRADPEYRWWKLTLFRLVRRVISEGSGGVSTVVVTTAVLAVGGLIATRDVPLPVFVLEVVLAVYVVAVAACFAAYLALRAQDPTGFARVALTGRSPADAIRITAFQFRAECLVTLGIAAPLDELLQRELLPLAGGDVEQTRLRLRSAIAARAVDIGRRLDELRGQLAHRARCVQRVRALVEALATRLGASYADVCRHVMSAEPELLGRDMVEFANRWQSLLVAADPVASTVEAAPAETLAELVRRNAATLDKAREAAVRLQQRVVGRGQPMLGMFCRAGRDRDRAEPIARYARDLSTIAVAGSRAFELGTRSADADRGRVAREVYEQVVQGLRELRGLLRAYPGLEPHAVCVRICRIARRWPGVRGDPAQRSAWDGIRHMLDPAATPSASEPTVAPDRDFESLGRFGGMVTRHVAACHETIAARFTDLLRSAITDPSRAWLVAVGSGDTASRLIQAGRLALGDPPVVRVVALGDGDDRDLRLLARSPRRGDEVVLVIEAEVVDAECFVVHRYRGDLDGLRRTWRDRGVTVRVVGIAEAFRTRWRLAAHGLAEGALPFGRHVDRVDVVVTDRRLRVRRRTLFLSLGVDADLEDGIESVVLLAWRSAGCDVVRAAALKDGDALRDRILGCDALLQVAAVPRPTGRRIRSRLALEAGIARGAGVPIRQLEIDFDDEDWSPRVREAVAALFELA